MRYVAVLLVAAMAAIVALIPAPDDPAALPSPGVAKPPVAVCAVEEGSGRTTQVAVLSTIDGPTRLSLFAGGDAPGSLVTTTGASGSTVIPVTDIAAVGTVGALVELPKASSSAGVVISGPESLMGETCLSTPSPETFLTAASTVSGTSFTLQLMNPYAAEAIVTLRVSSEAGIESNDRFEAVVVPPQSSALLDFATLIPGRENLSVSVETVTGRVIAVGRQGVEGESTLWNAVPGAVDWFVPVPKEGGSRDLVLGNASALEADYEIDLYGSEGVEEAFESGTLPARGRVDVSLSEITTEVVGLHIVSTGPVVPTLRIDWESGFETTTGSPVSANRWMLPGIGAGGGWATVVIMNAGLEPSTVSIRPLRDDTTVRDIVVQPDDVLELTLEPADGFLIEGTSPIVVLATQHNAGGGSLAIGAPLTDE